jgi:hypothetical protein
MFVVPIALAQMPGCEAMIKQQAAMQKQMAEMSARLQSLVDDMNRADAAAKVDKMAAVINELVAQRTVMQKQMAEMQPAMMHHTMEHMQGGKGSMTGCPMMKQSGKKPESTTPHQH